jgi:TIR domain
MERTTSPSATASRRIFMSYRRQETAYATGWLFDRLAERYGRTQIFKDVDSLQPGDDFVAVIEAAVGSCSVLLALIGDEWLTVADETGRRRIDDPNDFVRIEIEAALARGVTVIPILVDGARMPQPTEVPESLGPLVRRQALELSPARFDFDFSQLLAVLDRFLNAAAAPSTPTRPSPEEQPAARSGGAGRTAVVALAVGLVVAVAAVVVALAMRPNAATSSSSRSEPPATTSSTTPATTPATTSSTTAARQDTRKPSVAATKFTVQSEGRTLLADPTEGLDLASGQVVGLLQSQLAWNGLSGRLFVFDVTTLGAKVLESVAFREVTPAQLASTTYGQGDANPPLSTAELPVGKVLAVHVADRSYAKVSVVKYGPGDALELQWITYRVS